MFEYIILIQNEYIINSFNVNQINAEIVLDSFRELIKYT